MEWMAERKWEGAGEGERGPGRDWKHVAVEEAKSGSVPRSSTAPQIGRQSPRPLAGGPRPVVQWGWCEEALGGYSSLRKRQNPGSACLGPGPQGFGVTEPGGQEKMGIKASSPAATGDRAVLSSPVLVPGLVV